MLHIKTGLANRNVENSRYLTLVELGICLTAAWRPSAYKKEAVRGCEAHGLVIHAYTSDEKKTECAHVRGKVHIYYTTWNAFLSATSARFPRLFLLTYLSNSRSLVIAVAVTIHLHFLKIERKCHHNSNPSRSGGKLAPTRPKSPSCSGNSAFPTR